MSKFNPTTKGSTKTVNHEGASAYLPTAKLELMLRTMSFMMSGDSFYEKEKDTSKAIADLVKKISAKDPEFIIKHLIPFVRNEMYLRSVPVFMLVEYAKSGVHLNGAYKYVPQILKRADEPAEALALYFATASRTPEAEAKRKRDLEKAGRPYVQKVTPPVPDVLERGIASALNNFDEYQFGKYNRKGIVSLKDVLFLTHPKPKSKAQQKIFDKIVNDNLETPFTWETHISKNGASKKTWEEVIPNMGFMALLRNLNNFVKNDVDLTPVIKKLTDPQAVANSKQFPYRFFSAYKALAYGETRSYSFEYADETKNAPTKLLDAIHDAMDLSVANIPKIRGKTFIASDNSGSMHWAISNKSNVANIDIASLFSAISLNICDESKVGVFGQTYATVPLSKRATILDNMKKIRETDVGHSTNAWLAIQNILTRKEYYDRIFLFSDMQCYNTYGYDRDDQLAGIVNKYRKDVNPTCRLYSFDLSSYGLLKFPENDPLTCPIAGYSDTVFRFVPMFEEGRETMLKSIESYTSPK